MHTLLDLNLAAELHRVRSSRRPTTSATRAGRTVEPSAPVGESIAAPDGAAVSPAV